MILTLVRHGIAEDREVFAETGKPDELRPLTLRGQKRMKQCALGLSRVVGEVDILASSPWVRAVQSRKIIAEKFPGIRQLDLDILKPENSFEQVIDWVKRQRRAQNICLVGHDPHLSGLAGYLVSGRPQLYFSLRKGGVCVLEFIDKIDAGRAQILCLIQPSLLRRIKSQI